MRIVHIIPQFPWFGGRTIVGGHASCLLALSLAQAEAGDDVTILSYRQGSSGSEEIADRLRVHSLFPRETPGTIGFGIRFLRAVRAWTGVHRDRFDLVHSHSGFADYFAVAAAAQRATGLPTLHTLYCPIPRHGGRWRLPIVHGVLRRQLNGLEARTAMSRNVAESMKAWGAKDVLHTPPALAIDRFHPPTDDRPLRRELGLRDDEIAILFVGNAKPQKNLAGLLRAFAQLRQSRPNVRLVITTELKQSASDAQMAVINGLVEELGLREQIIQRGIVDNMPELMRSCDILAAPFLDTFGPSDYFMAVLEAMACGRPVVVSAIGGMPEVVSDDVGALIDPADPGAIAAALEDLVVHEDRRLRAGARARDVVLEHFNPATVVRTHADLYRELTR